MRLMRRKIRNRHSPTYAIVTFRKIWRESNFAQVGIDYRPTYGYLYVYIQATKAAVETSAYSNFIVSSMNPLPLPRPTMLSPSNTLPPPSSHFALCKNVSISINYFKLHKSETAYVGEFLHMPTI